MTQMSSFKNSEFKDFCVNFCLCSVFNVFIEKKYASLKGEVRGNPDPPSYAPVLVACVASVSVRFRSKERGTRVKMALVSFLVRPKPRIPFLGLSLLRNQTKRFRPRLLSWTIISTLRTVRLVPMHIKWHLCDVNARSYAFATLGMRGNFDSIFLGISDARKLKTYRKSSNKPPSPIFRGRKLISPPSPPP